MSIKTIRHRLLYFKDLFQGTIYTALSNARWLTALTPVLAFVVRPLLGLTLSSLAILQAWSFYHTAHKNIDGWMGTASSLTGALFNNIAAFGGFLARIQGSIFVLAPWFFVAGFTVGALNQLVLAGLNFRRAYEVWSETDRRQHYIQAAIFNLITAVQLSSCVTAIVLFNLFPTNVLFITGFALTVVAINAGSCVWRFCSSDTKKEIKNALGLGKIESIQKEEHDVCSIDKKQKSEETPQYTRLFTSCNHSAVIKNMEQEDSKNYLLRVISQKLIVLNKNTHNDKNMQKISVLEMLKQVLIENKSLSNASKIHQKYPKLVNNFWCEKSDTQQLVEAVESYCKAHLSEVKLDESLRYY